MNTLPPDQCTYFHSPQVLLSIAFSIYNSTHWTLNQWQLRLIFLFFLFSFLPFAFTSQAKTHSQWRDCTGPGSNLIGCLDLSLPNFTSLSPFTCERVHWKSPQNSLHLLHSPQQLTASSGPFLLALTDLAIHWLVSSYFFTPWPLGRNATHKTTLTTTTFTVPCYFHGARPPPPSPSSSTPTDASTLVCVE